jgi:MEKHLA domain
MIPIPENVPLAQWMELTQNLLDSYVRWTGKELLERAAPDKELLALWNSPHVVVAHGTQSDPAFVYGNLRALELWEMSLDQFLGMPSRLTAEPVHRDERQRLLDQTRKQGYVDDYRGVRISRTGKRFMIEKALLWMVLDRNGDTIGQAATFDHWTPLAQ